MTDNFFNKKIRVDYICKRNNRLIENKMDYNI